MSYRILIISLLTSLTSIGQTINTDAPSMTPSAEVVTPRTFQYEGRMQYTENSGHRLDLPLNLFRIGLSKRFEFRTINSYYRYAGNFGKAWHIGQIQMGLKYAILAHPERKIKMAILGHYVLPSPGYSKYQGGNLSLSVSHSLNDRSSISYSITGSYSVNMSIPADLTTVTPTFAYSNKLSDRLNVFGEVYGTYMVSYIASQLTEDMNVNFDAGAYYLLRDNIQIDYTFGYGLTERMYFHSIGFDFMIAPKKK